MNQISILGTGTSTGIPITGCPCAVCNSDDFRDTRYRTSAIIETKSKRYIQIDVGADFRNQALVNNIKQVDSCIITHEHADHVHGIDDLRPYCFLQKKSIPIYTSELTAKKLEQKFDYIFQRKKLFTDSKPIGGGIPHLDLEIVNEFEKTQIEGEEFTFFLMPHGHTQTLGFVHSKMAYLVDCKEIPAQALDFLKQQNLEILIIDCLRKQPHSTHLHFEQTVDYIQQIQPKFAGLIHISHDFSHQEILALLDKKKVKNCRPLIDSEALFYS